MDQLTDQISIEELSGKGAAALVQSLTNIISLREKYFDLLVPQLLKLTERASASGTAIDSRDGPDLELEIALKQSLLSLMQDRTSSRQKSMLLLGLSQLGAKIHPASEYAARQSWYGGY